MNHFENLMLFTYSVHLAVYVKMQLLTCQCRHNVGPSLMIFLLC